MVKMFQEKMAGEGNDPDDLIVQAFKAYDNEGKIDDIFGEFEIDEDYMIKTKDVIGLFVSVKEVEKCSKHSFYLRALKITVIRNPFNCVYLYLCGRAVYHPQQRPSPYFAN